MAKVIIFGLKDLAELAHYYLMNDTDHEVIAFCVNEKYLPQKKQFKSLPIVPFEKVEQLYPINEYSFFAPMSTANMNILREKIYNSIKAKGYNLISYISSKACVANNVKIGDNCFIQEGNIIHPFCKIGNNIVLFSNNLVAHHGIVKDHVTFGSHVAMASNSIIEENSFLGINSTIRNNIIIAKGTLVGIASVITKNTEEWSIYMGSPAKKIGKNSSKKFLKTS